MNLSKSYVLGILFTLSVLIYSPVLAKTSAAKATSSSSFSNSVLIASIDIKDPAIISQKDNVFNVSFSLVNRGDLQTGVKYGVKLVSIKDNSIVDEKVYDDSLTLSKGSSIQKSIIYNAPAYLDGSYSISLESKNENGIPFATVDLGKVDLVASTKIVQISSDSCFLTVQGEKDSPHYTLNQSVDIGADETLILHCTATNNTNSDLLMTPFFETREFDAFGTIAQQNGGDYTSIDFKKGEKKIIFYNSAKK